MKLKWISLNIFNGAGVLGVGAVQKEGEGSCMLRSNVSQVMITRDPFL